jgi:hypothetical protein
LVFKNPKKKYPDHLYFLNDIIKEGFNDFDINERSGEKSFCRKYKSTPSILNEQSKTLTKMSCMNTDCTVWTNNELCVAGSLEGPVYRTKDGKSTNTDSYYYMNKCYGKCGHVK